MMSSQIIKYVSLRVVTKGLRFFFFDITPTIVRNGTLHCNFVLKVFLYIQSFHFRKILHLSKTNTEF